MEKEIPTSTPKRKTKAPRRKEEKLDPPPQTTNGFDSYKTYKVYRLIEPGPVLLVTTGGTNPFL
jgi:hypothetical protein